MDTVITNISELIRVTDKGIPRLGKSQSDLNIVKNCSMGIKDGKIVYIGKRPRKAKRKIDAQGRAVTPGLVDAHTHLVFAGSRANEFEMRLQGKSYLEILKNGGGIHNTVKATNRASFDELARLGKERLVTMRSYGTTTAEAKSGYSLSYEGEINSLKVLEKLARFNIVNIVPTLLSAHAIPPKIDRRDYMQTIVDKIIPTTVQKGLAKFCDVFCDEGAFTLAETELILDAAKAWGLDCKAHAEEFTHTGVSKLDLTSADHLLNADKTDIRTMSAKNTIAVLLPATSFFLGARYAPARDMIENNVAVALGTDFNPGSSMTLNMQLVMTIACTQLRMTPAEAIVAATLNSAYSCKMNDQVGSIDLGKKGDIVIWNCKSYNEIPYFFGVNQVYKVIKS